MKEKLSNRLNNIKPSLTVATNVKANAITIAISTLTVTAYAEQTPKTCLVIGLLSINGSENIFFDIILSS